ncbi:MAG: tetratricopeptide repeat protein [Syntrophaceae bacterium]|nr:tetratricopeptide repeat protein [Syntrophaceae bacterium]
MLSIIFFLSMGTYQRNALYNSEIELMFDCISKSPRKARPHHNLGYVYLNVGLLDDARKKFEEALRLDPLYVESIYSLGVVFHKKGLLEEAIGYYKKAADRANIPDVLYRLGLAYIEKGLHIEAISTYEKLLEVKPEYESAHLNLGLAYGALKKWSEAIQSFQGELRYHPDNFYAYIYLGFVYKELEDYPRAIGHLRKALSYPGVPDSEGIFKVISDLEAKHKHKGERQD